MAKLSLAAVLGSLPAFILFLSLVSTVHSQNVTHSPGHCIYRGQCQKTEDGTGWYNCFYNGPPSQINDTKSELYKLILDSCPQLVSSKNQSDWLVCCTLDQVQTLVNQTLIAQNLFARCPACFRNFMTHYCATTCDPNMATFMSIPQGDIVPINDTASYVREVNVYVTLDYANSIYNSCKNVQYPENPSTKVVDLMCGGVKQCNSTNWLTFFGDDPANGGLSPFQYYYKFNQVPPDNMTNFNLSDVTLYGCDDTESGLSCSCSDCPTNSTCPALPYVEITTAFLHEIQYVIVVVGGSVTLIVFFITLMAALISSFMQTRRLHTPISTTSAPAPLQYRNTNTDKVDDDDDDEQETAVTSAGNIAKDYCTDYVAQDKVFYSIGHKFENCFKKIFYFWGKFAAKYWYLVLLFSFLISAGLCCGLFFFKVTTDPVELWSSPDSRARQEKDYFDTNFSPLYRTEMIIAKLHPDIEGFGFEPYNIQLAFWNFSGLYRLEVLNELLAIQEHLTDMEVPFTDAGGKEYNITLNDICLKPLGTSCTIQSVTNYFQNNYTRLNYVDRNLFGTVVANSSNHIYYCTKDITALKGKYLPFPCLGAYGGPIDPKVVLGDFKGIDYTLAKVAKIIFQLENSLDPQERKKAEAWEKAFLEYVERASQPGYLKYFNISYSAERSISDELNRESHTDIVMILISFIIMFVYASLFLGHLHSIWTLLVDLKILLSLFGVIIVLVAVGASLGFYSYIGVEASALIVKVVPFLVLAVGVDNLFIITHSYQRQIEKYARANDGSIQKVSTSELIGRTLGEVASSLILTSFSETAAFLLGGISNMPAVRAFSFYAGTAVFFNFLLQVTAFVSVLSLDVRRQLSNHHFHLKSKLNPSKFMMWYAKVVLNKFVRPFVLLFYGATITASLALMLNIQVGLDQQVVLPKDSYLMEYFSDLNSYLNTGSPVYFVVKEGFNYSDYDNQNMICSAADCDRFSLGTQITTYAQLPEYTKIAEPPMSWVDTYFEWLSPKSVCCAVNNVTHERCHNAGSGNCLHCETTTAVIPRPNVQQFEDYLPWFLSDNPSVTCATGGHAAFAGGVILNPDNKTVKTSYFMSYHTALANSSEFISALRQVRKLGANLTLTLGVEVFPYSVWYVYYEQYLTIIKDMGMNIGVSLAVVFVVSFLLLGLNVWAAFLLLAAVASIIVHMLGCMYWFKINANAVSLVNLVMTAGISVGFCSHIVHSFISNNSPSRHERAKYALSHTGAIIFSGITVTKFLGVFVLLFVHSQIFEVYYFRMYMCMLVWGALHGLVVLPVVLSFIGPNSYSKIVLNPGDYKTVPCSGDFDTALKSSHSSDYENSEKPKPHPLTTFAT